MSTEGIETVCENCGARTRLGAYYTFMQGHEVSPGTGGAVIYASQTLNPNAYQFTESEGVYLCNKCIALRDRRKSKIVFRNGSLAFLALLLVSIPLSLLMHRLFFVTPMMLVIFGGPVALFFFQTLKAKEQAPLRAYADLYNNPENHYIKGRDDTLAGQLILNTGEKMAIALKKPLLTGSGVDAFLTHQEAQTLTRLNPGRIDLEKQKHDGVRTMAIGALMGFFTVVLGLAGVNLVIVYLVSIFPMAYLAYGFGILTTGDPGPLPNQVVRWSCPHCKHELAADDLPTPGLKAVCPNCGTILGRKTWWG